MINFLYQNLSFKLLFGNKKFIFMSSCCVLNDSAGAIGSFIIVDTALTTEKIYLDHSRRICPPFSSIPTQANKSIITKTSNHITHAYFANHFLCIRKRNNAHRQSFQKRISEIGCKNLGECRSTAKARSRKYNLCYNRYCRICMATFLPLLYRITRTEVAAPSNPTGTGGKWFLEAT